MSGKQQRHGLDDRARPVARPVIVWAERRMRVLLVGALALCVGFILSGCAGEPLTDNGGPMAATDKDATNSDKKDVSVAVDTGGRDVTTDSVDAGNLGEDAVTGTICSTAKECADRYGKVVTQCQVAVCDDNGKCRIDDLESGTPCNGDQNACTPQDSCSNGKCFHGTLKVCNDKNECTDDSCDKQSGDCVFTPVSGEPTCDDGDDCTSFEKCKAGKCQTKPANNACPCGGDSVGACWGILQLDENNLCTGKPHCEEFIKKADGAEKAKKLRRCAINPASLKPCKADPDETECRKSVCVPNSGKCVLTAINEGKQCDDGISCNFSFEKCTNGECYHPIDAANNTCPCYPGQLKTCDDKELCSGKEYCSPIYDAASKQTDYKCAVNNSTVVVCPNGNDNNCQRNTCDKADGKCKIKMLNEGKLACDDGNLCTTQDTCLSGKCVGAKSLCKCKNNGECAGQEDGNFCNGTLYCDIGGSGDCIINPATVVTCSDVNDTNCLQNYCFPALGVCKLTPRENIREEISYKQVGKPGDLKLVETSKKLKAYPYKVRQVFCTDNSVCTVNDTCTKGKCLPNAQVCSCTKNADCAKEDDGNVCTGTLYCDLTTAKCQLNPASVVKCPKATGNACAVSTCDPIKGSCKVVAVPDDTVCDDGDKCTAGDACKAGSCNPGVRICECKTHADCTALENGNACDGTLYCDKIQNKCAINPATIVQCPAGLDTECARSQCNKKTGKCSMKPANENKDCDAGNPCAAAPSCSNGACSWTFNTCNCSKDADCDYVTAGNKCIGTAFCNKGLCALNTAKKPICPEIDDNVCTQRRCDPDTGTCALFATPQYTSCEDGNPCTVGDYCNANKTCLAGADTCQCKKDADCDVLKGGNACYPGFTCIANNCVPKDPITCNPQAEKGACAAHVCDPDNAACKWQTTSYCDDGDPCTIDVCTSKEKATPVCAHTNAAAGTACIAKSFGAGVCVANVGKSGATCTAPPTGGFLYVPGGKSAVGCDKASSATEEKPAHEVTVSGVWMQRYEVTVEDFKACMDSSSKDSCKALKAPISGSIDVNKASYACNWGVTGREKLPINCVTWAQASGYCKWVGARLPTDNEWAHAARGGCEFVSGSCVSKTPRYVWGDTPTPTCSLLVHHEQLLTSQGQNTGKGSGCGTGLSARVGSLSEGDKSPYGLNDMAGNVAEWVSDWYDVTWYATQAKDVKLAKDSTGPVKTGALTDRVIRGASWMTKTDAVRASLRGHAKPDSNAATLGFRCAIDL